VKNFYSPILMISAIAGIVACGQDDETEIVPEVKTCAQVATLGYEDLTAFSVVLTGEIVDDGNCAVLAKGFCGAVRPSIPWFDSLTYPVTVVEGEDSIFDGTLELFPGESYFVRAFVMNEKGTSYGNSIIVNTPGSRPSFLTYPSVVDITSSSATINFAANDNVIPTTVTVKFGTDTEYKNTAHEESFTGEKQFSVTLSDLEPETEYYYSILFSNVISNKGYNGEFTTGAAPAP
jgi:hypothetical protein